MTHVPVFLITGPPCRYARFASLALSTGGDNLVSPWRRPMPPSVRRSNPSLTTTCSSAVYDTRRRRAGGAPDSRCSPPRRWRPAVGLRRLPIANCHCVGIYSHTPQRHPPSDSDYPHAGRPRSLAAYDGSLCDLAVTATRTAARSPRRPQHPCASPPTPMPTPMHNTCASPPTPMHPLERASAACWYTGPSRRNGVTPRTTPHASLPLPTVLSAPRHARGAFLIVPDLHTSLPPPAVASTRACSAFCAGFAGITCDRWPK